MTRLFRRLSAHLREWRACRTRRCTYFTHYLAFGPADLTHEGYHAAEQLALRHFQNCRWDWAARGACQACVGWERRVRA